MARSTLRHAARSAIFLLALAALAAPARAWVPQGAMLDAVKAATAPTIDPSLRDPIWKTGTVFEKFYNFTTHQPAAHPTTAYLLYDAQNLYVAVHCEQAGTPIVATQTVENAGVGTDDNVALNLETSGNGGRVYQFRVNPHGVHDESSSENARYAPDWKSVTQILPNGDWNVVMVIPLNVIRAPGGGKQHWQIDVTRFVASTNDTYTWAYEDTMASVTSSAYWPTLAGIELASTAARPQPRADLYGLGAAGADRGVFQDGIGNFEPMKARPYGVDLTVPLTNTLAFVGTLNPDFSNVEQDQTTIAPQEFQRQYNEYRPFFAQGANYLNSLPGANINFADIPFYSPKIGVFNSGYKIEGTQGLSSIGLLDAAGDGFDDSVFGYSFTKPDQSFQLSAMGVDANHTGVDGTLDDVHDETFGIGTGSVNPHSGLFFNAKLLEDRGTEVADASQGDDLQVSSGLQTATSLLIVKYSDIGPQYAPFDGYVTVNDIRGPQIFYQYTGAGPKNGAIKSYQLLAGADRYVDRSGSAHESDVLSNASITFKDLITLQYGQTTSNLRTYVDGYPFYTGGAVLPFNQQTAYFGYRDGTPAPFDVSYSFGPFANGLGEPVFLQQPMISTSHQYGAWGINLMYSGAIDHALPYSGAVPLDSQWERSVSLTRSFGKNTSIALGLRGINGGGGFAQPGTNLAISFHERFKSLDELYVDYGTPAALTTLNRFLVKYIFHVGGETGT